MSDFHQRQLSSRRQFATGTRGHNFGEFEFILMSSKIDLRLELQTCKMNCVDPLDWFSHILTRIPQGGPAAKIEALMPRNLRPDAIG